MSAIDRLLRANRGVLFVPMVDIDNVAYLVGADETICPFATPSAAVLDTWRPVVTTAVPASSHGGNPSAAILDDMDLGLAASDTDTELVITSAGNEQTATFKNVDATLTALRDKNAADTGVFNLATKLFTGVDVRFGIVDRIGYDADAAYVAGQIVSVFEVTTDYPVDQKADRGNLKIQQAPAPSGNVANLVALAA